VVAVDLRDRAARRKSDSSDESLDSNDCSSSVEDDEYSLPAPAAAAMIRRITSFPSFRLFNGLASSWETDGNFSDSSPPIPSSRDRDTAKWTAVDPCAALASRCAARAAFVKRDSCIEFLAMNRAVAKEYLKQTQCWMLKAFAATRKLSATKDERIKGFHHNLRIREQQHFIQCNRQARKDGCNSRASQWLSGIDCEGGPTN